MKKSIVVSKVLLLSTDNKILLIRRSKTDTRRPLQWDLPGGFVDDHEDFTQAVKRELAEETGIELDRQDFRLCYTHSKVTDWGNVCWLLYLARTNTREVRLSHEHDLVNWIELDKAIEILEYDIQKNMLKYVYDNKLTV